jgi:DnaK suppressor protein
VPPGPLDLTLAGRLSDERQRAVEQVAARAAEYEAFVASAMPEGRDDEHDPDGSTPATEHALTVALLTAAEAHLAAVDRALERLDRGEYGRCQACGTMIGRERLEALPAAVTCVRCPRPSR